MTSLTLDKVPDPSFRFEVVPVPEFGQGEDGEPLTVNVYGLTALTKNILSRQTNDFVFDEAGELTTRPKVAKDSSCVIAALCSYESD